VVVVEAAAAVPKAQVILPVEVKVVVVAIPKQYQSLFFS
jgi:hypothetical protein